MSLLFNMLSRLVITFLPRSKHLLISWPQSPSAVILEPQKIVWHSFHCFPIYFPWSDGTRWDILSIAKLSNYSDRTSVFIILHSALYLFIDCTWGHARLFSSPDQGWFSSPAVEALTTGPSENSLNFIVERYPEVPDKRFAEKSAFALLFFSRVYLSL